ncbi:unannotated protein [freshwater metagenome]|uniref:Unannotated protein n=1 Tax=freshwater metagenome TaxID=449393 RepID=A0A6J7IKM4_9ZZZZ|nr:zinc ribbon domain-containing protein [Actinomycetota bacterium]
MTPTFAIFGIDNGTLSTAVGLGALAVAVIWLALVWFTFTDARRRIADPLVIASAVLAAVIFPFLGTMIYLIVRPPEFLEDVRERDLEMQAAEARLRSSDHQLCPHCEHVAGPDFLRCPHCLQKLRDRCGACARPLDPDWFVCPYCEAEIPGVTQYAEPAAPPRRRRSVTNEQPLTVDAVNEGFPGQDDPFTPGPYDDGRGGEPDPRSPETQY